VSGPFRRLRGVPFRLWDMLRLAPAARAVAWACLAGFLIQTVAGRVDVAEGVSFGEALQLGFGLHLPLLLSGFVWQVVTYMFLHGGWLHLLVNLLTLLLFGAGLEIEIGSRRFLRVFLSAAPWAARLGPRPTWPARGWRPRLWPGTAGCSAWRRRRPGVAAHRTATASASAPRAESSP
jgi:membrane associated rhomboid family serine protease